MLYTNFISLLIFSLTSTQTKYMPLEFAKIILEDHEVKLLFMQISL